jgi:hypothetical protein
MRKVFLLGAFFILTPLILVLSLSLLSLNFQNNISANNQDSKVSYATLPPSYGVLTPEIIQEDARLATVREFFLKYKSPLVANASDVIASADKYNLDYRLIPAIAMQESNLCKKTIKDSFNCWGFGIYGKKVTRFDSYKQAIDTVTKALARQYKEKGLETAEEIMSKYTPSSNGSWANGVNQFMNQLSYNL